MKSLYYKSLNAHMRKSRKEQNMQEMLDQVHNLNLKQKLNADLKREQAILNPIAVDLKRQEIMDKYKEHLGQFKEQKLRRKAEDKAKIDLYKSQLNNSRPNSQKILHDTDNQESQLPASRLAVSQLAAFRRGAPHGYTKNLLARNRPGMIQGQQRIKGGKRKAEAKVKAEAKAEPKAESKAKSKAKKNTLMQ